MNENVNHSNFSTSSRFHLLAACLGVLVLVAGGYSIYLGTQTQDLRRQFAVAQKDNATLRTELAGTDTELQGALNSLRDDLSQAQQDASTSLAKAASAATRHADVVASQLAKRPPNKPRSSTPNWAR